MFNLSEVSMAADQLAQATSARAASRLSPYSASQQSQVAADIVRALRLRGAFLRGTLSSLATALSDRIHDSHGNTATSPRV